MSFASERTNDERFIVCCLFNSFEVTKKILIQIKDKKMITHHSVCRCVLIKCLFISNRE